jgi:hypothetical protein
VAAVGLKKAVGGAPKPGAANGMGMKKDTGSKTTVVKKTEEENDLIDIDNVNGNNGGVDGGPANELPNGGGATDGPGDPTSRLNGCLIDIEGNGNVGEAGIAGATNGEYAANPLNGVDNPNVGEAQLTPFASRQIEQGGDDELNGLRAANVEDPLESRQPGDLLG